MTVDSYLNELNKPQKEAVLSEDQYLRVVAGAGSGKTKVLTYRIANLILNHKAYPSQILAITFTNKVANEMLQRVTALINDTPKPLIKTFHSFSSYFLRCEIDAIGYPTSFNIIDEEDQLKILKDIAVEKGYKRGDDVVKKAQFFIAMNKLRQRYPDDISKSSLITSSDKLSYEFYEEYEEIKAKQLALDFDDLILQTNRILESFPNIKRKYQSRYKYILVDEFQDTNDAEYRLLLNLLSDDCSLFVVGDPDQTIYTWRGANQKIFLNMDRDFHKTKTIILNENYRSTKKILEPSNKLISFNKERIAKDLFTSKDGGDNVVIRQSSSSEDEADFVAKTILTLHDVNKISYSKIAILYRANYITLPFEKAFVHRQIPYAIYGGMKFYLRKEIKDVLSYFKLLVNKKDDLSFERIINIPRRGIGETTVNIIKKEALDNNLSLFEYIESDISCNSLASKKAINTLKAMTKLVEITNDNLQSEEETISKVLEDYVSSLNLYNYYTDLEDGDEKVENVLELFSDLRNYLKNNPTATFDEYLQNVALISAQDSIEDSDKVKLMTVHTAKGLEFPVVFVVHLNQGVFPSNRALLESGYKALEEERRLCYVAFTRAKERLYVSFTNDYSYVLGSYCQPSSFISEAGLLVKPESYYTSSKDKNPTPNTQKTIETVSTAPIKPSYLDNGIHNWKVGDVVIHKKLGRGVVTKLNGDDIITVNFEKCGLKEILGNHPFVSRGE